MESFCTRPTDRPTTCPSLISRPIRKLRVSRQARAPGRLPSCPIQIEQWRCGSFSDDKYFLRSDTSGEAVLERSRSDDRGTHEFEWLCVAHVRPPRHAPVQ